MTKQVLWLDVDGVLLDYTRAFIEFNGLDVAYDDVLQYDLSELFGGDKGKTYAAMKVFHNSGHFAYLNPLVDRTKLVELKLAGYDIRVITQLTLYGIGYEDYKPRISRLTNLAHFYGDVFNEVVFTRSGQCKIDYIQARRRNDPRTEHILLEDNPTLLEKANNFAFDIRDDRGYIYVIGIRRPYNASALVELDNLVQYDETEEALNALLVRRLMLTDGK